MRRHFATLDVFSDRRFAGNPLEQGYEMGRPSLIRLRITIAAGRLVAASIGGGAVLVTEGTIEA